MAWLKYGKCSECGKNITIGLGCNADRFKEHLCKKCQRIKELKSDSCTPQPRNKGALPDRNMWS